MVVLTVVTPSNDHTIYFKHPLPKPNYIRLISCSLYNSWLNLQTKAEISITDEETKKQTIVKLPPGHYTPEIIAKILTQVLKLPIEAKAPQGIIAFNNTEKLKIGMTDNLCLFFKVDQKYHIFVVNNLTSPSAYFIHCDLVDKEQNLLNGAPSSVLAQFDIKGEPYEKINYQTTQANVLGDTSTGEYVNSVTLSVRDESGNLFDFNGLPLEFKLEIN